MGGRVYEHQYLFPLQRLDTVTIMVSGRPWLVVREGGHTDLRRYTHWLVTRLADPDSGGGWMISTPGRTLVGGSPQTEVLYEEQL
ncbi:hypothetical protein GCM10010520_11530 [Rhizobium viscosum]